MGNTIKITVVTAEDWQGLYLNNMLVDEGHSLDMAKVIESITRKVNYIVDKLSEEGWHFNGLIYFFYEIDQDEMEDLGEFPIRFGELDMEKLELVSSAY